VEKLCRFRDRRGSQRAHSEAAQDRHGRDYPISIIRPVTRFPSRDSHCRRVPVGFSSLCYGASFRTAFSGIRETTAAVDLCARAWTQVLPCSCGLLGGKGCLDRYETSVFTNKSIRSAGLARQVHSLPSGVSEIGSEDFLKTYRAPAGAAISG